MLGEGLKGARRMRAHVRQQWTRYYCPCGVGKRNRDVIFQHQHDQQHSSQHRGIEGCINEVEHYKAFSQKFGLLSRPMAACRLYLKGSGKLSLNKRGFYSPALRVAGSAKCRPSTAHSNVQEPAQKKRENAATVIRTTAYLQLPPLSATRSSVDMTARSR